MRHGLAILILALLVGAARADEVFLANGDRLTGTVVRKEGDELIFRTGYAGEIKIAWSQVVRVTSEEPMALILSDQSLAQTNVLGSVPEPKPAEPKPAESKQAQAETEAAKELSAGPQPAEPPALAERPAAAEAEPPALAERPAAAEAEPAAIEIDEVAYINAGSGIDLLGVRWKGRINVAANGNRGNSRTDNLRIEGEAVARQRRNRWTIGGVFDRGKDLGAVTRDNTRISGKYDLFINDTWYGYSIYTFEEDRFRDIDRRDTIGAGIGHQLIDTERTHLSFEGGLNYVRTDFDLASDESYPAARWAVNYDQRLFGTEMKLFHNHEILSDLTDPAHTFIRVQTGLRLPLLRQLMATAQLNVDYDNSPAPGTAKSDRVYLIGVGYHW
jgi:putative salt-induced outer membrane protein YdiY